jgi:hypothetical protein
MATHNRLLGKCVQVDHQPIRRLFVESYRMPNPDSLPTVSWTPIGPGIISTDRLGITNCSIARQIFDSMS